MNGGPDDSTMDVVGDGVKEWDAWEGWRNDGVGIVDTGRSRLPQ